MSINIKIITFYKFIDLNNIEHLQSIIRDLCTSLKIKGTILLSTEGINGTIAGRAEDIEKLIDFFSTKPEFHDLNYKISYYDQYPFDRLKIRIKKEIVTMGIKSLNPAKQTGIYVDPIDWNRLISEPDVITLDTRNKYETQMGIFNNAIDPNINTFTEFPNFFNKKFAHLNKDSKIAMYCTGGIRCEKSTAYLLNLGFSNVYHLQGGILNYFTKVPIEQSLWKGECFIFDKRIGIDHNINKGNYSMCYGCRYPVSYIDKQSTKYKEGIHCPHCVDFIADKTIKRATERHKQISLLKSKVTTKAITQNIK